MAIRPPGRYSQTNPYNPKFGRVAVTPQNFNALIASQGTRIKMEKAVLCPNYIGNKNSGQHDINCQKCDNGFIHYSPVEVFGFFQANNINRMFEAKGTWDVGTALLSVPTHDELKNPIDINYFDRVTVLDFTARWYELIEHTRSDTDYLKYEAVKVEYVCTKDKTFLEGQDFEIDDHGNIHWITGNRPGYDVIRGEGETYSISYQYNMIYRVVEMLHEGRFVLAGFREPERTGSRLPQQVLIKRDYLLEKRDSDGVLIKPALSTG